MKHLYWRASRDAPWEWLDTDDGNNSIEFLRDSYAAAFACGEFDIRDEPADVEEETCDHHLEDR